MLRIIEYVATVRSLLYRVRSAELVLHVQHATLDREMDVTIPRATVLSKQALEDLLESERQFGEGETVSAEEARERFGTDE